MQLPSSTFFLAALSAVMMSAVNAAPTATPPPPTGFESLVGPAPYEELKALVAARQKGEVQERDAVEKRNLGGLYLCSDFGFGGSCYYGIYEAYKQIFPDPYWVTRISSAGPDSGTLCILYNNSGCGSRSAYGEYAQDFITPGGNLNTNLNDNVQCFICRAN